MNQCCAGTNKWNFLSARVWARGEGLWVKTWSAEIRLQGHIYRKENINSIPPLLNKADNFLTFTFFGMSCGYHFIIIVNRSTAFKKKRNYKGHLKLTPDCKCICTHDGRVRDLNTAEGLTPITDSTDTREDILISSRYLCVRFTPKMTCSLWLLSPAETGAQTSR